MGNWLGAPLAVGLGAVVALAYGIYVALRYPICAGWRNDWGRWL